MQRIKTFILVISIHAPTKGATLSTLRNTQCLHHFNPRSHEGSDPFRFCMNQMMIYFNPRSHERSDDVADSVYGSMPVISIHAPTKGATQRLVLFQLIFSFQSTLPRRERRHRVCNRQNTGQFQSTLPRRERH